MFLFSSKFACIDKYACSTLRSADLKRGSSTPKRPRKTLFIRTFISNKSNRGNIHRISASFARERRTIDRLVSHWIRSVSRKLLCKGSIRWFSLSAFCFHCAIGVFCSADSWPLDRVSDTLRRHYQTLLAFIPLLHNYKQRTQNIFNPLSLRKTCQRAHKKFLFKNKKDEGEQYFWPKRIILVQ